MHFAQRFLRFLKATIVGGVFVLAPFGLLVYLIGKALAMAYNALHPLMQWMPIKSVGGVSLIFVAAVGALVGVCFLAGLLANTALAKWLVTTIETAILTNLPGYTLMKSMGEGIAGVDRPDQRKAVLVRFDGRSQIGFLMDQLPDGQLAVFVPNVPSPWSGALHILPAERVEILAAPIRDVIERLQRMGHGIGQCTQPAGS